MLRNFLEMSAFMSAAEGVIDLRSDTVTRPTAAMRAAMAAAEVGDDVFGDDPSVNALQQRIAALLGKEAALFMPSGTQSNLCALMAHCGAATSTSSARWPTPTAGKAAARRCWAASSRSPAHQADGSLALADIEAGHQARRSALRAHAAAGAGEHLGRPGAAAALHRAGHRAGAAHGLATHLDGARLFNAAVARGARGPPHGAVRAIAGLFDSVSVCFSKGLGAPVGSALAAAELMPAPCASARCWAACHAPGRRAGRRGRCMRWTTMSSGWPMTTPTPAGWPTAWPAWRHVRAARHQHRLRRPRARKGRPRHRCGGGRARRVAAPACTGCAWSPTST
jgi:hypothetical protein